MDLATAPETALIRQARRGSRAAAEELFRRHWRDVWKAAFAVTGREALADDTAQDAFVRAFGALEQFDDRREFGPWVKRIAVNRAIDELRRERRLQLVQQPEGAAAPAAARADDTIEAVRRLAPQKRLVVILHFWLGYGLEQIAELLAVPPGTVASRLSRGLAELREELEVDRADSA